MERAQRVSVIPPSVHVKPSDLYTTAPTCQSQEGEGPHCDKTPFSGRKRGIKKDMQLHLELAKSFKDGKNVSEVVDGSSEKD